MAPGAALAQAGLEVAVALANKMARTAWAVMRLEPDAAGGAARCRVARIPEIAPDLRPALTASLRGGTNVME
jgi:hypothetical protein